MNIKPKPISTKQKRRVVHSTHKGSPAISLSKNQRFSHLQNGHTRESEHQPLRQYESLSRIGVKIVKKNKAKAQNIIIRHNCCQVPDFSEVKQKLSRLKRQARPRRLDMPGCPDQFDKFDKPEKLSEQPSMLPQLAVQSSDFESQQPQFRGSLSLNFSCSNSKHRRKTGFTDHIGHTGHSGHNGMTAHKHTLKALVDAPTNPRVHSKSRNKPVWTRATRGTRGIKEACRTRMGREVAGIRYVTRISNQGPFGLAADPCATPEAQPGLAGSGHNAAELYAVVGTSQEILDSHPLRDAKRGVEKAGASENSSSLDNSIVHCEDSLSTERKKTKINIKFNFPVLENSKFQNLNHSFENLPVKIKPKRSQPTLSHDSQSKKVIKSFNHHISPQIPYCPQDLNAMKDSQFSTLTPKIIHIIDSESPNAAINSSLRDQIRSLTRNHLHNYRRPTQYQKRFNGISPAITKPVLGLDWSITNLKSNQRLLKKTPKFSFNKGKAPLMMVPSMMRRVRMQ
ncbi:unnamed protein product [Moneuplotes crassus]|uniref:Uncharacterized protein n=1 Tax=Euplotes crassus TaxID=5936 RepID=A0AAD1U6F2_EUPCR|nr:unnamed protein product [Moneuplotes crassus]